MLLAAAQVGLAPGVVGHVQGAFAAQLAIDAVLVHQAEHQRRRRTEHAIEPAADLLAETGLDLVRWNPHAGIHQADVTPRAPLPGTLGLHHADPLALFQQMHRRRQTGEAGADDADIRRLLAPQWRVVRPVRSQSFP